MFFPKKIRKNDPKALEASNLVVDAAVKDAVQSILKREVPVGQYLSPEDIKALKAGKFDISCLMPGVSPFWERPDIQAFRETVTADAACFPRPDEKLTYKGPRYRSWISTKMSATFVRDGEEHVIKIKLGEEIHSDILSSYLRRAMGFFQDKMQHSENLKLHLGNNKTYQEFERDLAIKYGINTLKQAIVARGKEKLTGEEWVVFKSAALELRPKTDIRATTVDSGVYDGANRRELRARRLLRGFLGLADTKPTNHRLVFQKDGDGTLRPQYRFQDPGASMGTTLVMQRPRDLLRYPYVKNKIQEYDRNYVYKNKKGDVSIIYNDGYFHKRDDGDATYADYKWMARVIGALPDDVIRAGIHHAGIPKPLQKIYFYHIGNMKNRALRAFDLDQAENHAGSTLPINVSEIGPLSDINVEGFVKNGKITATHAPGRLMLPKLQETWFLFFNGLSSLVKQDFNKTIEKKFDLEYQGIVHSVVKKSAHVQASVLRDEVPQKICSFSLTPGVSLAVQRIVLPNPTHFNAQGKGRGYLVKDQISIEVGVEASVFKTLSSTFTPDVGGKLKCFTMNLEHQHFSETVLSGYKHPIGIHKLLFGNQLDQFALKSLAPGEAMKLHWSVGLDTRATTFLTLKTPSKSMISAKSGASVALSWLKAAELTYAKDTLGSLHLIQENIRQRGVDFLVDLANIETTYPKGSFFNQRYMRSNIKQKYMDIEVVPPSYDQERGEQAFSEYDIDQAASWLKKLRSNPDLIERCERGELADDSLSIPDYIQLHYNVDAQRVVKSSRHHFFYVLDNAKSKSEVNFNTNSRNHTYRFHKITSAKKGLVGIEDLGVGRAMNTLLLKSGTSKMLTIEMDRNNPKKFIGILDIYDYKRTLSREQLIDFIGELNQRYSESDDKPFFRTGLLPSKENYKKIYSNGRVYVDGAALLRRLDDIDMRDFEKTIELAFKERNQNVQGAGRFNPAQMVDDRIIARKIAKLGREFKEMVDDFADHHALRGTEFEDGRDHKAMEDALAASAFDFIYTLYKSKFGLGLMQKILGKSSIFVLGEIYGIHQQTGMLHDDMWKTTLRFMGNSYGGGMKQNRSPIQNYIRHEQFQPPSDLARPRIEIEHFLGSVPVGLSGETVGFGNR